MPWSAPPNRAYGTLGAIYASGGVTLPLAAGQGARFGTLAGGNFFWILIEDKNESTWARFMIAKVTGISGDNLTIVPAEEGTSNSNFPITAGNPIQKVQIYAAHTLRQLRALRDGGGALIQATAPTLTMDSPRTLILTPAAPITVALPTTGVWAGMPFEIVNLGSLANTITVNASGGGTVMVIPGGRNAHILAYKDTPTAAADWGPLASYLPSVKIDSIDAGGTLIVGGAAPATPAAGKVVDYAVTTDAFGVAKSARRFKNEAGTEWELGGGATGRILAGVGLDLASYISGTGTAGVDNTAQSVKSIPIKGGSLNAIGRILRFRMVISNSNVSVVAAILHFYGSNVLNLVNTAGGADFIVDVSISYLSNTSVNILINSPSVPSQNMQFAVTVTSLAVDGLFDIWQPQVASTHIIVREIRAEQMG